MITFKNIEYFSQKPYIIKKPKLLRIEMTNVYKKNYFERFIKTTEKLR